MSAGRPVRPASSAARDLAAALRAMRALAREDRGNGAARMEAHNAADACFHFGVLRWEQLRALEAWIGKW